MSDVSENVGVEEESRAEKKLSLEAPSPFAELEVKNKLPLILYSVSLGIFLLFVILLSINGGQLDKSWSSGLYQWAHDSSPSQFALFLLGMSELVGGLLVSVIILVIGIVFVISRNKNVMKYGGEFVVMALIGFILTVILMALSGRSAPDYSSGDASNFTPWYAFQGVSSINLLFSVSFPSLVMVVVTAVYGLPYCFNSPKTKIWNDITSVLAVLYVSFTALGLVASGRYWFSDVVFPAIYQYWIAALVGKRILDIREQELYDVYERVHLPVEKAYRKILTAKSVLNYSEVSYLFKKVRKNFEKELEKLKKQKEKGKEVMFIDEIEKILSLIDESISLVDTDRAKVQENLEKIFEYMDEIISGSDKKPKFISRSEPILGDIRSILEDNKSYALKTLQEAIELYEKGIEAAKNEPGDFQYVIDKAEIWKEYAQRFLEELEKLESTSGPEFERYMKANFLYII